MWVTHLELAYGNELFHFESHTFCVVFCPHLDCFACAQIFYTNLHPLYIMFALKLLIDNYRQEQFPV